MSVETPTINRIIRINEFDLLRTKISKFSMYMCLDSQKLYYDETDNKRVVYGYQGVKTVNDLLYNITPSLGTTYYCWEDNSLWLWMNKWITLWSDSTYPSAYVYDNWNNNRGNLKEVYRYDQPLMPADDNGLLHDGSVIIRDRQRIIKGKLYINDGNDNLVISSYLGGGIRILPNGQMDTNGELFISDENNSFLRSELTIKNNEEYIDYSEKPSEDPATEKLMKSTHRYKVYHEGNLDASLIKPLTGEAVYNVLINDKDTLPDPFDFNVSKLDGMTKDDFALKQHTHTASEITDFNQKSIEQANIAFKTLMNTIKGEGITITHDVNSIYTFSANDFKLTFTGDVTGNGTISHLSNTNINMVVDPTKHIHQDYIDRMDDIQNQINHLDIMDRKDYYTKTQTDELIDEVRGTQTPTYNKPLLVNKDLEFDINVTSATKLKDVKHIELTGDMTGSVDTDFNNNIITMATSASNIVSAAPTPGKALFVDKDGNLPCNSTSSSELNHTIAFTISNEASGTAVLDTSKNTFNINVKLVPGDNIVQSKDLDVTVATLDENKKLKDNQIPDKLLVPVLKPQGTFNPNNGEPTTTPSEGHFWTSEVRGIIDDKIILAGDYYVYLNSKWNILSTNQNVISVNGKQDDVVLNYKDVQAISDTYIDYTIGDTVPENKIPITTKDGVLGGVTVDKLTNEFSVLTDNTGDIQIDTDNSKNIKTDGSKNIDTKLMITQNGYNNILDTVGIKIQNGGGKLTHKGNLNFDNEFIITAQDDNTYKVNLVSTLTAFNLLYISSEQEIDEQLLETLTGLYSSKDIKPAIIVRGYDSSKYNIEDNKLQLYLLDSTLPSGVSNSNVIVTPLSGTIKQFVNNNNGSRSVQYNYNYMQLHFKDTEDLEIDNVQFITTNNVKEKIDYLPIDNLDTVSTPFIPTNDKQPTSKKYVDDTINSLSYKTIIGNGTDKEFIIQHNLNSEDIIIQFRSTVTKQQVYIDNVVIDKDNVKVTTDNYTLDTDEVSVTIFKC